MNAERLKKWLQAKGILPDNQTLAIAALAISLEDWKRELKRSQKRQRRGDDDGEDDED